MQSEMNYQDALAYIYHFTDYEKKGFAVYAPEFYSLKRVRRLLALMGDPQHAFRAVHIAGTKGKGSTSAMLEAVLRAAGFRTGLYISPHLHTFRERIQVSGKLIPESDLIRLLQQMRPLIEQVPDITTFEVMTSLAFGWFAEQGVDWAVLEVGLGGRLDATNVALPAVSVITSISYDHMLILGNTLTEIATEKAGIIKPQVPVVSAPQPDEVLAVLESVCAEQAAPLTLVGRDWTWRAGQANLDGQSFSAYHGQEQMPDLWLPLLGEHQLLNATVTLATLDLLRQGGAQIPDAASRAGLRSVCWPGRLEILGRQPFLVVDSAHNGDSAQKLMAALQALFDFERLVMIVGASLDHATPEMLHALLSPADRVIFTRSHHPRAADPAQLQARAPEGIVSETSESVGEALDRALAEARPGDMLCCAGSVFVAAEARIAWFTRQGLPLPPLDPA
jgi:dihydrofolate synthase/folylpolyglutamate synthase